MVFSRAGVFLPPTASHPDQQCISSHFFHKLGYLFNSISYHFSLTAAAHLVTRIDWHHESCSCVANEDGNQAGRER